MQFSNLNQIVSALLNLIEFIAKLLCSAGQVVAERDGARGRSRQEKKRGICDLLISKKSLQIYNLRTKQKNLRAHLWPLKKKLL